MKLGLVVQEVMLFKEYVYRRTDDGWTDDGQRPITIAHLEPLAQVSKKLKNRSNRIISDGSACVLCGV